MTDAANTLIRIADWGSVEDRIDSEDKVDFFTLSGVKAGTTVSAILIMGLNLFREFPPGFF